MIEIHLYGKLRQFADDSATTSQSIAWVPWQSGDTVGDIVDRLGINHADLGSNIFLNGRYSDRTNLVQDGDRLGLFPDDMQLLYKWYFASSQGSRASKSSSEDPRRSEELEK